MCCWIRFGFISDCISDWKLCSCSGFCIGSGRVPVDISAESTNSLKKKPKNQCGAEVRVCLHIMKHSWNRNCSPVRWSTDSLRLLFNIMYSVTYWAVRPAVMCLPFRTRRWMTGRLFAVKSYEIWCRMPTPLWTISAATTQSRPSAKPWPYWRPLHQR